MGDEWSVLISACADGVSGAVCNAKVFAERAERLDDGCLRHERGARQDRERLAGAGLWRVEGRQGADEPRRDGQERVGIEESERLYGDGLESPLVGGEELRDVRGVRLAHQARLRVEREAGERARADAPVGIVE